MTVWLQYMYVIMAIANSTSTSIYRSVMHDLDSILSFIARGYAYAFLYFDINMQRTQEPI